MSSAVSGHGAFIYNAKEAIARYGSPEQVAKAVVECDMRHVWIRVHGASQIHSEFPTLPLIHALKAQGVAVAGWGWCQGAQIEAETELAITSIQQFQLDDYIADIEEGVNNASWTVEEVRTFLSGVRSSLPDARIGVSSFGFIPWHKPELMEAADEFVDFFAPQVYWFSFPSMKILNSVGASPGEFPLDSATAYARLCLREWRRVVTKPLVLTGQAYWGESADFIQARAEAKLRSFLGAFDEWDQLQGINWWHFGGKGQAAMSFDMYQAIKDAKLNGKFEVVEPPVPEEPEPAVEPPQPEPPSPAVVTVKQFALESATSGACSTEGVTGLSQQIFSVLKESFGDEDIVSCADVVEIAGQSTIPFLQPVAKRALERAIADMGEPIKLIHAFRTIAQQYVLYRWFKTGNCRITLAALPGSSPHEQAIAIDIKENARWRAVLEQHHWRWRGPTDPGHFTYVGGGVSSRIRSGGIEAFQRLWNRHNPNDLIEEDGIYGEQETGPRLLKSPITGW